jgi:hypothetical protein
LWSVHYQASDSDKSVATTSARSEEAHLLLPAGQAYVGFLFRCHSNPISHVMALEDAPQGYKMFHDNQNEVTKVVLKPDFAAAAE